MSKYRLGLVSIKLGDIAADGGMGTALSAIGDTVAGTAVLTSADDTKTDFNTEEAASAILSVTSKQGDITLVWSTYNNDTDTLLRIFGGTKNGDGSWEAPDEFPELEQSIQVQWKTGGSIIIPRAKISGKLNFSFKKDALSQIDITATVLQPAKAGVRRLRVVPDDAAAAA